MNFKAVVEGLLFVSGDEGLTLEEISNIIDKTKDDTTTIIKELYNDYDKNDRGMHLEFLGNRFKFTTKSEHKEFYQKLIKDDENSILSQSALETLAIIAYNQPVSRAFIEQVRGVDSSSSVKILLERNLIEEAGRLEIPGRPLSYKTTDVFLRSFSLSSLSRLPKVKVEKEGQLSTDDLSLEEEENDDII